MLMKNNVDSCVPEDSLQPNDSLLYLKLAHTPVQALQHAHQSPELFTRFVCTCVWVCMHASVCTRLYTEMTLQDNDIYVNVLWLNYEIGTYVCVCVPQRHATTSAVKITTYCVL